MMTRLTPVLVSVLLLSSTLQTRADVVDPGAVTEEIRTTRLDSENAVEVDGVRLSAGLARIVLSSGVLIPATPVAGRVVEYAFVGDGRIELEPPDEVEAGQLELFTGSRVLRESFTNAVFVVALDAASDAVTRGQTVDHAIEGPEGGLLLDAWLASPERKLLDIDARIFADALGDPLAGGFFCGVFDGLRLGRFLLVVDPLAREQVTLGQFVQPDLTRKDERRIRRTIEQAQRKGKLIGLEVDDLGTWDTWISTSLFGSDGDSLYGSRGVEPNHYDIVASLDGGDFELEAGATLRMRVVVDGLLAVAFEMNPDLTPSRVVDGQGRELEWFRSRNELVAALAEPARPGDELDIRIDYGGFPIEKVAGGTWVQRNTTGWYPRCGIVDRATYTVTIHLSDGVDIVASGTPIAQGEDADRRRWTTWSLDRVSSGVSFEIGKYDFARGMAGDVSISVAVDKLGRKAEKGLADEILRTAVDVVEYYSEIFGPYPLDELQIVSSPRGFSQGLLGFVSLSTAAMMDYDIWRAILGVEDRRTVIAHEIAHQWWGNLIGWTGYRDQWISEAMANYSALLWYRNRLDPGRDGGVGWGPTAMWQSRLLRTTSDGRPVESLGPLVLGVRLDSSISDQAYQAIVYKKGAVVLDMLSRYFRDDTFNEILRELVDAAAGRVISTDVFLRGISRLGGTDLEWFSRQYVYGTGLPEIHYSSSFEVLEDGRWAVSGTATQRPPYHSRFTVVETPSAALDLRYSASAQIDVSSSMLVVPVQIGLARNDSGARQELTGRLLVSGETSSFRFDIEHEPEVLWLDRESEVFGRFFATDRWPKRVAYEEGLDLEAAGDLEGARETYRRALEAMVAAVPPGWEEFFRDVDVASEGRSLDARIRLALARLELDDGRLSEAETELEHASDLVRSRDRWLLASDLLVAESRLELLSGDARAAFRRLKKNLLGKRGIDAPETWALLAIAADAVGDTEVFDRAAERAGELGVDLGPLATH
jgi:hypothetical protein